jgi:GxxExxY protein
MSNHHRVLEPVRVRWRRMTGSGLNPTEWDPQQYKHQDITEAIIAIFNEVYNELGNGFLESVYERAMAIALAHRGLDVKAQFPLPVWFREVQIGDFRADLLIAGVVMVELKAGRALEPVHEAQLLNYLRACDVEVGLLLNFGPVPKIKRLVFANERTKNLRPSALVCG